MKAPAGDLLRLSPELVVLLVVASLTAHCSAQTGEITVAIHVHSAIPESKKQVLSASIALGSLKPLFLGTETPSNNAGRARGEPSASPLQNNLPACSAVSRCPSFSPCNGASPLSGIHACDSPHGLYDSDQSLADVRSRRNATCLVEEDEVRMTRVVPSHCSVSTALLRMIPHAWSRKGFTSYPESKERRARGGAMQAAVVRDWAGRVFRLEDVFVDWRGRVFNATHRFYAGGCSRSSWEAHDGEDEDSADEDDREDFSFPAGTPVTAYKAIISLISGSAAASIMELIEKFPLLLTLAPIIVQLPDVPVLMEKQKLVHGMLSDTLGVPFGSHAVHHMRSRNKLIRVAHLYQPLFQPCNHPSPALWRAFRSHHLLPPSGLPLLRFSPSSPSPTLSHASPIHPRSIAPAKPTNWVVVLATPASLSSRAGKHAEVDSWLSAIRQDGGEQRVQEVERAMAAMLVVAQKHLEMLFGSDRVVVLHHRLPLLETRSLFNRALLLVGFDSALSNMVFMPFASAVLEIQLPPELYNTTGSSSSSASEGGRPEQLQQHLQQLLHLKHRFRNLAEASGNTHFVLECTTDPDLRHAMLEGDGGRISDLVVDFAWGIGDIAGEQKELVEQFCGMNRLRLALEGVVQALYAMDGFNRAVWRKPPSHGGEPLIPGTAVTTEARLQSLRKWQECVSTRGEWVYNPKPRILPWNFRNRTEYCERKHIKAGFVVLDEADGIAEAWGVQHRGGEGGVELGASVGESRTVREEDWHVKEMLKYKWRPDSECGSWLRFNPRRFCASRAEGGWGPKRKSIVVIGDSLNEQFARSLVNNILLNVRKPVPHWAVEVEFPEECRAWIRSDVRFCAVYRFNTSECSGMSVSFLRTDYLTLSNHAQTPSSMPWSRIMTILGRADLIVANRGAHYTRDRTFLSGIRSALRFLRRLHPNKLIIWRSTPPGHKDCDSFDQPLKESQELNALPHHWGWFPHQNAIAKRQVERVGSIFMDLDTISMARADGHLGYSWEKHKKDCLHYCMPGPMDTWVQLLYNILLKYNKV